MSSIRRLLCDIISLRDRENAESERRNMPGQFNTKVALVTGAASGVGRATALAFTREGTSVVVSDVATQGGEETVRLIKEAGGEATFVKCDVSHSEEVKALVTKAVDT
jgi:NAD(P)-dependent dehydrogenase (short-subunit alcohol dehydrogenase family)